MADARRDFRDFGILPEGATPPAGAVRAGFSRGRIAGQYVGTAIVSLVGLGLGGLFVWLLPMPLNLLGAAAALLGAGAVVYLATRRDYRWVELDGGTIRAKHLYTGRIIERRVADIESLGTMVYPVRTLAVAAVEGLLGRIKGIEVRFRDRGAPLRVMRADPAMTNAKALVEAIVYRMSELRPLEVDVVDLDGRPLVRRIFWRGETPFVPRGNAGRVAAACLMLLALLFGMILAFMSAAGREELRITSVPPQVITLRSLIDHGPGENRHVTLTGFRPGGFAYEARGGRWSQAWVALFPADAKPGAPAEIAAVLETRAAGSAAELRALLITGRVTGICSRSLRTTWGATLGPQLRESNPGSRLEGAWSIEHVVAPPRAEDVRRSQTGAAACFAAVILLAIGILWASRSGGGVATRAG